MGNHDLPDNALVEFVPVPTVIEYWDTENPNSVICKVDEFQDDLFTTAMMENRDALDYLLSLDEDELKKQCKPSHDTNHLRLRFWKEFELSQRMNQPMNLNRIIESIATVPMFYGQINTISKLAWILRPPKDYLDDIEESLRFAVSDIREILGADIRNEDGSLNPSVMNAKLKAFGMLDNRVKGLPAKNINKRTVAINVQQNTKQLRGVAQGMELSEEEKVNQELMALKQSLAQIQHDPRVLGSLSRPDIIVPLQEEKKSDS